MGFQFVFESVNGDTRLDVLRKVIPKSLGAAAEKAFGDVNTGVSKLNE